MRFSSAKLTAFSGVFTALISGLLVACGVFAIELLYGAYESRKNEEVQIRRVPKEARLTMELAWTPEVNH